jgi:hypothetical protein
MKKILFVLVALLFAAPAWAAVNITAAQDAGDKCLAIISFDATGEPNLARAFSLNIQADNDANIVEVVLLSADYVIHPGSIVIDTSGNVTDYGSPVAPQSDLPSDTLPGLDSNGVTIEMASLYAPVGPGSPNAPAPSGDLISVRVDKECTLTITANVSRAGSTGVVMESPDEAVTVNLPAPITLTGCGAITECLLDTAPEHQAWLDWGKPDCWCYARQCRGDADGVKTGPFWVAIPDLNMFRAAFNKTDLVLQGIANGICSDADHTKTGPFRVAIPDLNIFRLYFNKPELSVPECDNTYVPVWCTPGNPCPPTP